MLVLDGFIGDLYQRSKDEMIQISHIFFQPFNSFFNIVYP